MRGFILTLILATVSTIAMAQNANSSSTQRTKLALGNAIDISFVATGSSTGNTTTLSFNNVNDYANGVESGQITLKVRANKRFMVRAKTSSNIFSYSGSTSPAPQMKVNKTLYIKVVANNTGGTVPNAVNNKYKNLRTSYRKLINKATPGENNTFAVQYKADPGFEFPAGTYTTEVIYTATQQ